MSSINSSLAENSAEVPETPVSNPNVLDASIFNRSVVESLIPNVRLSDSDPETGLDLFCYVSCSYTDSDLLKQCRGVIFNKDELVSKTFPYTIEYTETDNDEIMKNIDLKNCLVYDSYEGSIIKIFHYADKWYVCTNRKLDAFKSKWSSKDSFGFFFQKALENQFRTNEFFSEFSNIESEKVIEVFTNNFLDKDKQYVFLLLNNSENRIVCMEPKEPTIFHVGTFINGELSMNENIGISYPYKHTFSNIEEVYLYVDDIDYSKLQGVIIFAPNNKQYKILNRSYKNLYSARGNEASINFRYIQVRMDPKMNEMLRFLYNDKRDSFDEYENYLFKTSKVIYDAYVQRFIKKQYVSLPVEEFKVMSEAHAWHQQDRENNKISHNKIIEILNSQPPTNLNRIIRRLKLEKKLDGLNLEEKDVVRQKGLLPRNKQKELLPRNKQKINKE
jgi:hypothetical protein